MRNTLGRFLLWRELAALRRLAGLRGVPADAFRLDAHAIAARYLPGTTLAELPPGRVSTSFLEALERLLRRVHQCGMVHLDTRGGGNMLMMPDGEPGIFDFQAALSTQWMPAGLRRLLGVVRPLRHLQEVGAVAAGEPRREPARALRAHDALAPLLDLPRLHGHPEVTPPARPALVPERRP